MLNTAISSISSSFSKKDLEFVFTMANQSFSGTNANRLTIKGLRSYVDYTSTGGSSSYVLCKIYGISLEIMNQLTTLQGDITTQYQNQLQINIIDGDITNLLFNGTIYSCWASFENMPDVYLFVQASPTYIDKIKFNESRSYASDTEVDIIVKQIADEFKIPYINNGVTSIMRGGLYLSGSIVEQLNKLADQAGFYWTIEPGALYIFPRNGNISNEIRLISSETGLIGYPVFDNQTVTFRYLYSSNIFWGSQVNIQSILSRANGIRTIIGLTHNLTSQVPDGPWFSTIRCSTSVLPLGQIS